MKRRIAALLVAAIAACVLVTPALADPPEAPIDVQILAVSDWHAQLDPLNGVGGAAALSSYWKDDRAANPNTLTLTAGDAYGASPPLSAFFNEEPAVKAMNLMGFTADTFGNHNFDKGIAHLQSMIDLADFDYISANLQNVDNELDGVFPWKVYDVGGVKVGVVGVTNPEAPSLVFPGSFGSIVPTDPVPAANKAKAAAKAAGAKVLVAIGHLGITGVDASGAPTGPLRDFAENVGGFDVILGDHTDVQYEAVINNALVIENRSRGLTYSRTTVSVDARNGRVIDRDNEFVTPTAAGRTDQAIVDMLAPYRTALGAAFDGKIGTATAVLPQSSTLVRTQEIAVGNLVADSMRVRYGTQLAIANGGGIRKPLPSDYAPLASGFVRSGCSVATPCDILVGDAYAVLPFGNTAVTRTITGAKLHAVLEHSVGSMPASNGKFLQISGFRFTYDTTKSPRVQSVTLAGGTPILADGTVYTLALPDFTNAGGDGYTMLADGQGTSREFMAEVLRAHIQTLGPLTNTTDGRITRLG